MIAIGLRSGLRAALVHRRLLVTVWVWNLFLALIVGLGTSRWLGAAFDFSPEADQLLQRFHFGVLGELQQYDRFSPFTFLGGAVLALIVVSAISNPIVSAGVLEVLAARDDRPLLHRFFRGAGHFFGRFLRLLVISAVAFLLLAAVLSSILSPIGRAFDSRGWELALYSTGMLRSALLLVAGALVMAILDIARARVVTAEAELRGMLRAWIRAAGFVLRYLGAIAGIYVVLGVVWVALAAAGLAIVSVTPVTSWAGIWLLVIVQQAFMLARAGLRVARAGATLQCVALTAERAEVADTRQPAAYSADSAVSPG